MNIGMVVDNEFYGDPRVMNESRILQESGHRIFVLCLNFGKYPAKENFDGIEIIRISLNRKVKNLLFFVGNVFPAYYWIWAIKIKMMIAQNKIDILHLHDLYMLKAGIRVKKKIKTRLVVDLHENYPAVVMNYQWVTRFPNILLTQPWRWKSFEKKHLKDADYIVVLCNNFKSVIQRRYSNIDSSMLVVYPNVPNPDRLLSYTIKENVINRQKKEVVLFYFGGISERRGVFDSIASLKILGQKGYEIKLLLIGPVDQAEKDKFFRVINEELVKPKIIYIPWIDISEFPSYVTASDICLSPIFKNPQHESGVANKVFQYMLFAKPIVVSNNIPQVEIVNEEKCGLVFQSNDPVDLAEKIEILINNPLMRETLGLNGRNAVLKRYNTKTMSKELIRLYAGIE